MPSSELRRTPARPVAAVFLLAALTSSASACTIINDVDRVQCSTDNDCRKRGGAFAEAVCRNSVCVPDPTWGCLGKVDWTAPDGGGGGGAGGKVTARLVLTDLVTTAPVTDATARVCGKLDPECATPLATDFTSDAQGILAVELDKHFDGFLEISAPGKLSPTLYFFYPPVDSDRVVPYCPLVPPSAYNTLAMQLNATLWADRGAAIALSYDCSGVTAPGLEFGIDQSDEKTLPFFMEKGLPTITAIETDSSGQGGFVNVLPGIRRLTGTLRQTGTHVGTVTVVVRAPFITYTTMVPTPD
jgi:hypothetical protein